jgi:hypothetical protein
MHPSHGVALPEASREPRVLSLSDVKISVKLRGGVM